MGRCGRSTIGDYKNMNNSYHAIYNLKDFVCFNERLCLNNEQDVVDPSSSSDSSTVNHDDNLSKEELRIMKQHVRRCSDIF